MGTRQLKDIPDDSRLTQLPVSASGVIREGTYFTRFRLVKLVARGSAADVYRAYDPQIDREIALRLIKIEDQDPELLAAERLGTVLQSTAERVSVQTARVLDYGEAEGFFFVATEFVQGESLDQILSSSGALSPRGAITIASKLCGFIEQLQSITPPIVHGDIKPQNIIVTDEETIRVIDFGIARLLLQTSTPTRNLFGTLPYVAPERLQKHSVDRLSDLWSVSIILYQMVTGRLPFGSASGDVAEFEREVAAGNLQHISEEIPQALAGIIRRSLDPDPEKRYSSATALRHALEEFSRTQEFVQWDSTSEASAQDSRESSDAAVYDHRTGKVLRADEIKARLDHGTDKNESAEYDELYAFVTDASTSIGHRVDNVVSSISLLRRDFAEIIELLGAGLEGSMSATVEKRQ